MKSMTNRHSRVPVAVSVSSVFVAAVCWLSACTPTFAMPLS
jgi:hypothetical protein